MKNKLVSIPFQLGFIVGTMLLLILPLLPGYLSIAAILAVLITIKKNLHPIAYQWAIGVLLALLWSVCSVKHVLSSLKFVTEQHVNITGVILTVNPDTKVRRAATKVRVIAVNDKALPYWEQFFIKIKPSFWGEDSYFAGERWNFFLRIRPVHDRLNGIGWNQQRTALSEGVATVGYVKTSLKLTNTKTLRQRFILHVDSHLKEYRYGGLMLSLLCGVRSALAEETRLTFEKTGTAHLMAISGMHISTAGLTGYYVGKGLQYLLPVHWMRGNFPVLIGWFFMSAYTVLSGMQIPACRAWLAVTLWLYLSITCCFLSKTDTFLRCVVLLILCNPLSILSISFWLSCVTVGSLGLWCYLIPFPRVWRKPVWAFPLKGLHLQLGITLFTFPLQLFFFKGANAFLLLSNLIAIPVVAALVVPVLLLSLFMLPWPRCAQYVWATVDSILNLLVCLLQKLEGYFFVLSSRELTISATVIALFFYFDVAYGKALRTPL